MFYKKTYNGDIQYPSFEEVTAMTATVFIRSTLDDATFYNDYSLASVNTYIANMVSSIADCTKGDTNLSNIANKTNNGQLITLCSMLFSLYNAKSDIDLDDVTILTYRHQFGVSVRYHGKTFFFVADKNDNVSIYWVNTNIPSPAMMRMFIIPNEGEAVYKRAVARFVTTEEDLYITDIDDLTKLMDYLRRNADSILNTN